MGTVRPNLPEPPEDPQVYVGLDAKAARAQALHRGWRKVRQIPKDAVITLEYMSGRLTLAVEDGIVVDAWDG